MQIIKQTKPLIDPISGRTLSEGSYEIMEEYCNTINNLGYDYAIALATEAEVINGSACGQLAMINVEVDETP
jgi:adenine C2-methylase RlmN of 23S rRNA A2503 and tRNA A37